MIWRSLGVTAKPGGRTVFLPSIPAVVSLPNHRNIPESPQHDLLMMAAFCL